MLFFKNLLFTVLVPGAVAGWIPWLLLRRGPSSRVLAGWTLAAGVLLGLAGCAIYGWTLWDFAAFGRGTPAPIDAPRRSVPRGLP